MKQNVMNDRIFQALAKLFDRHRIVFWYDVRQELRDDYPKLGAALKKIVGLDEKED
jgi:hypothetical protein